MKILRNILRKIKYKLKFLNKNETVKLNYTVNSSSNSKLTKLMNLYGSDKGGKNNHHNYAQYYSLIFGNKKKNVKNFLEIGLGSNNVEVPSNMGEDGKPLASLRAWRDFFINANVYGADVDKEILKDENRIKTFYVDQLNTNSIINMWNNINLYNFDIANQQDFYSYASNRLKHYKRKIQDDAN